MAHFCWQLKFVFLLLMLCCVNARPAPVPAPAGRQSELIAGNEFLKLLLNHDAPQRSLHSDEELEEGGRQSSARSLEHKSRYRNAHAQQEAQKNKQVVKLVTTGSKIVFLEDAPASKIKPKSKDEVKVVAVSVSSSSKRGGRISRNQQQPGSYQRSSSSPSAAGIDFVNRSHKSELTIEESEPRVAPDVMDAESDSLNSASNIQNVLAAPLLAAAASSRSSSAVAYRTGRNATEAATATATATAVDDKLLPFQTVIYHDSKQGHGPQSRSISYSSISQHVDDLQLTGGGWQRSAGILAEAQRNVSESLKPMPRLASEPSKFYSVPAKMYSLPAKFYSEPAKVYSEPAKMYGQPEKVYSEPAKVYGVPSKFYSEPAKVYGEPAKTYWPTTVGTTSTPTTPSAVTVPTTAAAIALTSTTATPAAATASSTFVPSRRPAIVSRIAFGEAQSTTSRSITSTTTTATTSSSSSSSSSHKPSTWQQHYHSGQQHQQQQHHFQQQLRHKAPHRVLFNLDKLPYDLLNAPQPNANPSQDYQQRPCWEQQQQQQHQQRQHSSLSLQHSNQNAKGLPNRDLVKCVAKFAHQQHQQQHAAPAAAAAAISAYSYSSSSSSTSSSSSAAVAAAAAGAAAPSLPHFTTERAELYTPTPEQNYEIEESVSVMTNGRAHGVQAGGVSGGSSSISNSPLSTTASPVTTTTRARNRGIDRGRGTVVYNANANANDYDGDGDGEDANNGEGDGDGGAEDEDKVAYVVEGRNYRKYRVEEKTDDGFIVGEYGVVDHNDGNLSGVRYTADSTIDRSLIQKALLTFLKLK
ncbi:homeotic protein labial [Drosophila busckii]|uniref:homeotic protein labial n=1 Tax=Drosophila busckii TaxID=30019 RepID=UPI00083EBDCF|nr:homeotic protein labial [Drosophila busckii]XP_017849420.1 homeotic protein labial [Drosophila busckii]